MQAPIRMVFTAILFASLASSAQAHFIWLVPVVQKDGTTVVQVYFGEDASPDDPDFLGRVKGMKLQSITGQQKPQDLKLHLSKTELTAKVPADRKSSLFIGSHDLGVFDRGESVFYLNYYAKTGPAVTHKVWQNTDSKDDLRLDLVPALNNGKLTLTACFDGKPVADAQIVASGPGLDHLEDKTDQFGKTSISIADAGLYSIRARHIEDKSGEHQGKKYDSVRHYTTLTLNVPKNVISTVAAKSTVAKKGQEIHYPNIPKEVTSFGGAMTDNALFIYGGHTGEAHSYYNEAQANTLWKLDLKQTKQWESLGEGPRLQGLAMVAYDNKLYRIGGFTARNKEGDEADLWSQADVACYDILKNRWHNTASLPEPRSSFDAAVLDGKIHVVGGWNMQGDAERIWHKTAYSLNLNSDNPVWKPLPEAPFQRRALAVAAYEGKIYAIGGMQMKGGPTTRIDIYNPATQKWSEGPSLKGEKGIVGFGCSAFATGGHLYVSTMNGELQRLADDGKSWEVVRKLDRPRFFHRMLPLNDHQLISVGGASMSTGKHAEIDVIELN